MTEENQGKNYDRIATDFAKLRDSFYSEKKYLDLLLTYLQPNAHILDVGCGSGYPIAAYLIEQGFQVTGIDGSIELLNIANIITTSPADLKKIPPVELSLILNELKLTNARSGNVPKAKASIENPPFIKLPVVSA